MALTQGSRLGPYEVLSLLGSGGMGEVHRARDPRLGRDVALKVLPADRSADPERVRRFEQEARAVASLSHPNILAVHDVGREGEITYVVFELLEGRTLRQRLEEGPLPPRKTIDWAVQMCRGLSAAHAHGIVHRDLKPENVFVTGEGQVKILDFGLAALERPELGEDGGSTAATASVETEPGAVLGTVGYMSPEQVRGQKADARSDLFVLGAILYEMLSGKRAFRGDSAADALSAILHHDPPEIATAEGPLSPGLDRVVRRCLEKDREERFQSARDLGFALEALSGSAAASRSPVDLPPRRGRGWKWAATIVSAAALVAAALAAGRALWRRPLPVVTQLTYENGLVEAARFAPDGRTVVFSALWNGRPPELFQIRLEDLEPRPLGFVHARLLAVSSTAELAILQGRPGDTGWIGIGTLMRVPLSGGRPRPVLENVAAADWSPDGRELAVVRWDAGGRPPRLEYPIGTVLVPELPASIPIALVPRVSPRGDRVAVTTGTDEVLIVDRQGTQRRLKALPLTHGLAWDEGGDALWLSAGDTSPRGLWHMSLDGRLTHAYQALGSMLLHDAAHGRRFLVHHGHQHLGVRVKGPGESSERDIATTGEAAPVGLTLDGTRVLIREGPTSDVVYLHPTDGGPATRLVKDVGRLFGLSPDGRWLLYSPSSEKVGLVLAPTGAGDARRLPTERFEQVLGARFEAESQVSAWASEPARPPRGWMLDTTLGSWTPLTPEGVRPVWVRLPQRETIGFDVARGDYGRYPFDGRPAQELGWAFDTDRFPALYGTADGRFGFLWRRGVPAVVDRVDLDTGECRPWRRLEPEDRAGVGFVGPVIVRPEADAYVYYYGRFLHHLSLVEGLR